MRRTLFPRSNRTRTDRCFACDTPATELDQALAGPSALICPACACLALAVLSDGAFHGRFTLAADSAQPCSFCRSARAPLATSRSGVGICSDCVAVCLQMLRHAQPAT